MPDSITTWVTEAIGLSERQGLGLAKRAELRTFKPFFVDFTLPYSLIRGEQTKVPLTVYNYLPTCAEVSQQKGRGKGVKGQGYHLFRCVCVAFSAEVDVTGPHDVEADPLIVSTVSVFSCFFSVLD